MLNTPYMSQLTGISEDPFDVFLKLVRGLGKGQVFLLDSAVDDDRPDDRLSILGAIPVLDLVVKKGQVTVAAIPALLTYLRDFLTESGYILRDRHDFSDKTVVKGSSVTLASPDPMQVLEQIRSAVKALQPAEGGAFIPFSNGLLGYLGYDAVHYLEKLPVTTTDDRDLPDVRLQWHLVTLHVSREQSIKFDALASLKQIMHEEAFQQLVARAEQVLDCLVGEPVPLAQVLTDLPDERAERTSLEEITEDVSQDEFAARVQQAKQYIENGDIFQVVLSKRLRVPKHQHPYVVYDHLRRVNPSPFMFMAEYPDMRLFGASPEVQFRSLRGRAQMKPIAGTSKGRGATPEEDALLAKRLLDDEKERAEHVMLVDLCRNDLGRVCQSGSVEVTRFLTVEAYSHLFHLVSTVEGQLRQDVSVFHALLSTFPAGTLSGAPKIRAMEIIDELETLRRGPYGGLIGMVDFDANANTAIVIRSIVDTLGQYYIQVGAGIVADSDPSLEWQECGHKSGALVQVLTSHE